MFQSRPLRTVIAAILGFLLFIGFITLPFAAIPVAAIGLAFGLGEAVLVAALTLLLTGLLASPALAFSFAILLVLPILFLVRMALLSRPRDPGDTKTPQNGQYVFYPAQRLALIAMAIAGLGALIMQGSFMSSPGGLTQALADVIANSPNIGRTLSQVYDISSPEQIRQVARWMLISGFAFWPISLLASLQIAQAAMVMSKKNLRPSPDYHAFTLPAVLQAVLAGLLLFGLVIDGWIATLALTLASIVLGGYFLLGLAVIHAISRLWKGRGLLLATLYFFLLMMAWVVIPVTLMGLLDTRFNFRRLHRNPDKPSDINRDKE